MIAYMGDPGRQLMHGSDWPLVEMGPYVRFLDTLEFDGEARENVSWRTAAELFGVHLQALGKSWRADEPGAIIGAIIASNRAWARPWYGPC